MARVKPISIVVIATVALAGVLASPVSAQVTHTLRGTAAVKSDEAPDIVFRSHPVKSPASATPLVEAAETGDSSGFDWGAALIGAGTVLGLGAVSGALLMRRRRQRPVAHGAV